VESRRGPKTSVSLPIVDTMVIASTDSPAIVRSATLLRRSSTGFGRMLRGTDQATFKAFWSAWPRPSDP
jgi:hypothetical protein